MNRDFSGEFHRSVRASQNVDAVGLVRQSCDINAARDQNSWFTIPWSDLSAQERRRGLSLRDRHPHNWQQEDVAVLDYEELEDDRGVWALQRYRCYRLREIPNTYSLHFTGWNEQYAFNHHLCAPTERTLLESSGIRGYFRFPGFHELAWEFCGSFVVRNLRAAADVDLPISGYDPEVEIALRMLNVAMEYTPIADHAMEYSDLAERLRHEVFSCTELRKLASTDASVQELLMFASWDCSQFAFHADDALEAEQFRQFLGT